MKDGMPEIIDFLLGSGTLNGWGYGERPGKTAPYWWRKDLREYHQDVTARLEAADAMARALEQYELALRAAADDYEKIAEVFKKQGYMNSHREAVETCAYIRAMLKTRGEALIAWRAGDGGKKQ